MAEIEIGRGMTPLPAALHAEAGAEQRCVVTVDDDGYHVNALESLSLPPWKVTYTWETVELLEVEPTDNGVSITIGDQSPGSHRVELRDASAPEIEAALAPYRARTKTA